MSKPPVRNRFTDPRRAAEAAFKAMTTKPLEAPAPKVQIIPNTRELVSLRIDQEVLEHFREGGAGWQERINQALRKAMAEATGTDAA